MSFQSCIVGQTYEVCVMCAQVKIFGGYTRWAADVPAPDAAMPARLALTTVDAAYRHATGDGPGPVHLNLQFREPLAPSQTPWPSSALQACSPLAQVLFLRYPLSSPLFFEPSCTQEG